MQVFLVQFILLKFYNKQHAMFFIVGSLTQEESIALKIFESVQIILRFIMKKNRIPMF